jgi:hypothetical protein
MALSLVANRLPSGTGNESMHRSVDMVSSGIRANGAAKAAPESFQSRRYGPPTTALAAAAR